MAVTIKLRYLRHSARKINPYARLLSGKKLERAIAESSVMSQDSAKFIHKGLLMVKAAAEAKEFEAGNLIISEIFATIGPKVKRMRPNARGRSNAYKKHLSHLQISVAETPKEAVKVNNKEAAKQAKESK